MKKQNVFNNFIILYGQTYLYERTILINLNHILNTIDDDDRVLYLHIKGVRFNGNHKGVKDWVDLMKYF